MKPVAVIHIDSLRREYPAGWLLGKRLEANGYRVVFTSRPTTARFLRLFTPEVVILSHVFAIPPELVRALHQCGARLFANEVEGEIEGNELGISGTYPEGVPYECFEKIFTWAEWSCRWLIQKRGLTADRVQSIGSIRSSLLRYFKAQPGTRTVGVLARFEVLNTYDGRHPFHNLSALDLGHPRGRMYLERSLVEMETFAITARIIDLLVGAGIRVTLRPHPNEDAAGYREMKAKYGDLLEIDAGIDYVAWLEKVSVVVGTLSSAYTEPYLLGIPIVSTVAMQQHNFNSDSFQRFFVSTFKQACHQPATTDELVALCADPSLAARRDATLDQQLEEIYSLRQRPDPVADLCAVVGPARPGTGRLGKLLVTPVKLLIDLATIASCLRHRSPQRTFRRIAQYDFNALLHRPSALMNRIS